MIASMDRIVRPWVTILSAPKPRDRSPPSEELPDAHIRWGAASQFENGNNFRKDAGNPGFQVIEEEPPLLYGEYQEEARTYSDIRIEDPEGSGGSVVVRQTSSIAFKALPNDRFDEKRGEQVILGFASGYTPASPVPSYLKNSRGEVFDPIVLDPTTTIIEVGWGADDFVLVSIMVKPRTSVEFGAQVENPRDTNIQFPNTPFGDPELDQNPPEGEQPIPFIELPASGSIVNPDESGDTYTKPPVALGLGPPVQRVESITGVVTAHHAGNAVAFRGSVERETWGQWADAPYCEGFGPAPLQWLPRHHPDTPNKPGCFLPWFRKKIIGSEEPFTNYDPYFISKVPEDGAIRDPNPGVDPPYQWKLDVGVTQADGTTNGITQTTDDFGGSADYIWYYRKWEAELSVKYDGSPFVYALLLINVSLMKRVLNPILQQQGDDNDLTFSILAGNADDPLESQGVGDSGTTGMADGRIRWQWVRGSSKTAYEAWVATLSAYDPEDLPSYDEVWEDLLFVDEGVVNQGEQGFPHGGGIEGELSVQITYRADFFSRELVEARIT